MNDEQRDLARRLAAHPRFQWRDGMLAVVASGWTARASERVRPDCGAVPDLTDAATGGVLLDMLTGECNTERWRAGDGANVWTVRKPGSWDYPTHAGDALAEACARALLAEWCEA